MKIDSRGRAPQWLVRSVLLRRAIRWSRFHLLRRPHEPEFSSLGSYVPGSVGLILDVGAHEGQSLLSLRQEFPKATIFAYEPNPFVWSELERSCAWANNAVAHHVGIGAECGELLLNIPNIGGYLGSQGSTFHKEFTDARYLDFVAAYGSESMEYIRVLTPIHSIDSMRIDPDFIKIDVEGAEWEVLHGARTTLSRTKCPVLFEVRGADSAPRELLRSLGYTFWVYRDGCYSEIEFDIDYGNAVNILAIWKAKML